ncbi:MAG: ABC transporter permease [Clostridiales bacterium]|nr:ABC transporter permease [Clostridiales bacterium]
MKKLFSFELRKLFRMKLLYICLGLAFVLAFLSTLITYFMLKQEFGDMLAEILGMYAPTGLSLLKSSLSGQDCLIIIALFVTLYVCDDNRHNTLKNIYAKGYGRDGVYYSKLIIALAVSVVFVLLDWLSSFVFGCAFFGVGEADRYIAATLVVQLLAVLAYASFFFFITTAIKKTGGSVVANVLILMFAAQLFSLLDYLIFRVSHNESFMISEYWLDGIIKVVAGEEVVAKNFIVSTVLCLIYASGFIVGGMFINRKREV